MGKFVDLTGRKFGRLTVIKRAGYYKKEIMWRCKCDCGKEVDVIGGSLKRGNTKSCGCLHNEVVNKYGFVDERLYRIWADMKTRCNNPNFKHFKHYGGRGIRICKSWENSFLAFSEWALEHGYLDNLTIDRIDVNGDYEPSNCRFITIQEQQWNKRGNIFVAYNGEQYTLKQLSELCGISIDTLHTRLCVNFWNVDEAIKTPVTRRNKKHKKVKLNDCA